MCGRYVTVSKLLAIEKRFGVRADDPSNYRANVNISPGDLAPVITNDAPKMLQFYQFGFTPFWAKKRMYVFNARAEGDHNQENEANYSGARGIIGKPMFRSSIRSKRCLVPADAFIEGPKDAKLSKPYVVYRCDGDRPFAFAGIWDSWTDKNSGEIVSSFAIITTASNDITAAIGHHRSPMVLSPEHESLWLNKEVPLSEITELLRPVNPSGLNAYPIDAAIKNPKSDGITLLEPKGPRILPEYDFIIYESLKLEGMGMTRSRLRGFL